MTTKEEPQSELDIQKHVISINRDQALDDLLRIKEKSDDDFEKNIIYITTGTLVLSLTFIEKIIDLGRSSGVIFLIASWILLSITLAGNLISHQLSSFFHERFRSMYSQSSDNEDLSNVKLAKYNLIIASFNWGTTITLFLGISMLVTFCSLNAYQKANNKESQTETMSTKEIQPQTNQPDTQKGRTIARPIPKPAQQPVTKPAQAPAKKTN